MLTAVTYRMNLMGSPPVATACSASALLAVASCATVPTMPAENSRTCGDGHDGGGIRQVEGARRHDPRRKRLVGIGGTRRLQQRDSVQHAGRRRKRVRSPGHAGARGGYGIEIVEVEAGIEPERRRDELLGGDGITVGRGRYLLDEGGQRRDRGRARRRLHRCR